MSMSREEIFSKVREDILWTGMQLEDLGYKLDAIHGDTQILGEEGLGLDSVDSLEIVVKIQKTFGIKIENVDRAFFEKHLGTINTIVDFVADAISVACQDPV